MGIANWLGEPINGPKIVSMLKKQQSKHVLFIFGTFFEKVSEAKSRYLGILYVYSCIVLISPIWNII